MCSFPCSLSQVNNDVLQVLCFFHLALTADILQFHCSTTRWWSRIACSNPLSLRVCDRKGCKEIVTLVLSIKPLCLYHVTWQVITTDNWGSYQTSLVNKQNNSKLTKIAFDVDLEPFLKKILVFLIEISLRSFRIALSLVGILSIRSYI